MCMRIMDELQARISFYPATVACGFAIALCAVSVAADEPRDIRDRNWPQWRGPLQNGVAPHADPPIHWDASTSILWKSPVPGAGSATPIVWENRIFVLSARETDIPTDQPRTPHPTAKTLPPEHKFDFIVTCLDRTTGATLWQ